MVFFDHRHVLYILIFTDFRTRLLFARARLHTGASSVVIAPLATSMTESGSIAGQGHSRLGLLHQQPTLNRAAKSIYWLSN